MSERREIEYGVFLDRREDGLGIYFAEAARSHQAAATIATRMRRVQKYPVSVRARVIIRGDWHEMADCPTCSGPTRETVGMVCQTCGTDYSRGEGVVGEEVEGA